MGQQTPVDILPTRWGSQPYPPNGYMTRGTRGMTVARGFPESDQGYKVVRTIGTPSASKSAASWIHSHTDGSRYVIYEWDTAIFYDEDDASPVSLVTGLTGVHAPMFANMGSPLGMSLRVNGTDAPRGIRIASAVPAAFAANFEKPDANWTATPSASGGSLADGVYQIRIAQVEVHATTGTIISRPSEVKTATVSGGGGSGSITVAQAGWTPNSRATHWRIGITAVGGTDAPSSYFYSADVAIGTTSSVIQTVPTVTPPFESRNGFYKGADLTEIIASKHPRGVICYEGRWIVWFKNDSRILWSERDEWGWYETNSLDTGAEGGWNLPVRCILGYHGHLLVFTEASIHAVFGDFARDLGGASPTYAANATPKTLITGYGMLGGPLSAKIGSDGRVYFISNAGPAVFDGTIDLLQPDDVLREWKALDKSSGYPDRWQVEEDPLTGTIWFLVTRKTNASRPLDGASVAGICDLALRWLPRRGVWDGPYQLDIVHLIARTNGALGATTTGPSLLMAMGPHGQAYQLGFGYAGGDADGVVTSTDFDGKLASSNTTTTAVIALAGISADALIGMTVTLYYPSGDSAYPYRVAQKTISDNTATSGGNVTLTWAGALTVPSTSFWTVRLCGRLVRLRVAVDPRGLPVQGATPASYYQLHQVEARFKDKVGSEAIG